MDLGRVGSLTGFRCNLCKTHSPLKDVSTLPGRSSTNGPVLDALVGIAESVEQMQTMLDMTIEAALEIRYGKEIAMEMKSWGERAEDDVIPDAFGLGAEAAVASKA